MMSDSAAGVCPPKSRVASDLKKTTPGSMLFIRMRSPRSAPPPRRRVGSIAKTAMRNLSWLSRRIRRTNSSVSDDLPEPPVPVMPSTGVVVVAAAPRISLARDSSLPDSKTVMARANAGIDPVRISSTPIDPMVSSRSHSATNLFIIPGKPRRWPSCGLKMCTPILANNSISAGTITPPPPPYTRTCPAPRSARRSTR